MTVLYCLPPTLDCKLCEGRTDSHSGPQAAVPTERWKCGQSSLSCAKNAACQLAAKTQYKATKYLSVYAD